MNGPTAKPLAVNPPSLKRLLAEKFESADEWFSQEFLPAFNAFASDVSSALTRNVAEEREISFTTGGSVAEGTAPFPLYIKPQYVRLVQSVTITCPCVEDGSLPTGAAQPQWRRTADGGVEIRLITGLATSTAYKMRLLLEP